MIYYLILYIASTQPLSYSADEGHLISMMTSMHYPSLSKKALTNLEKETFSLYMTTIDFLFDVYVTAYRLSSIILNNQKSECRQKHVSSSMRRSEAVRKYKADREAARIRTMSL